MLAKILDGVAFLLGLAGVISIDGTIYDGTCFLIPMVCLIGAVSAYCLARRENGDWRKANKQTPMQREDTGAEKWINPL